MLRVFFVTKTKRYKVKKIIIAFALLILFFVIGGIYFISKNDDKLYENSYEAYVQMVTDTYKTEFIVYGDDIGFEDECYTRKIDSLNKDILALSDDYVYSAIIINDLNNNIELTENDFEILYDASFNQKIDLFYFGSRYLEKFKEVGITVQPTLDSDLSIGVIYERGIRTEVAGLWDKELNNAYVESNPKLLSDILLTMYVSKIRFDNK